MTQTLLRIFLIALLLLCIIFGGCNKKEMDGYTEEIIKTLNGTWTIYQNDSVEGKIIFTDNSNLRMFSKRGNIDYGDYSEMPDIDKTIVITYAEDELGNEILTDEEYEVGGIYVSYNFINNKQCEVINLPFYSKEKLILKK